MKLFSDSLPFLKANFHCHTNRSDGRLTPEECAAFYRSAGYDILSVTDHRKVTEIRCDGLLMIPGTELDYNFFRGQCVHILGLGMEKDIETQWDPAGTPQEGIDLIARLGGIAVLAHPAWSLNTPAFIGSLSGLSGAEIWNSVSTLPVNGDRADASSLLDVTFASGGALLPLFANDDSHQYETEAGVASTMVQAGERTVPAVMDALRAGRFYATTGPRLEQIEYRDGREILVRCSPAESVVFYSNAPWAEGRVVSGHGMTECGYTVQRYDRFVRIEVRDAAGRKAWSSPFAVR